MATIVKLVAPFFFFTSIFSMAAEYGEWVENVSGDVNAVALVVHGFNGKSKSMHDVAVYLNSIGVSALVVTLAGHGDSDDVMRMNANEWRTSFARSFEQAHQKALSLHVKLVVVAHSMGCLLSSNYLLQESDSTSVSACIYFAPAQGLKPVWRCLLPYSGIAYACPQFLSSMIVASCADEHVARTDFPIAQALGALNELVTQTDEIRNTHHRTLALVDPADPLVCLELMRAINTERSLNWEVVSLPTGERAHMCIAQHHAGFHIACEAMKQFLQTL